MKSYRAPRARGRHLLVGVWCIVLALGCVPRGGGGGDGSIASPGRDGGGDGPVAGGDGAPPGRFDRGLDAAEGPVDGAADAKHAEDDAGRAGEDGPLDGALARDGGPPVDDRGAPVDANAPEDPDGSCACGDRLCGPDGCGGVCGRCPAGEACTAEGRCRAAPRCGDGTCGDDEDCALCPADCGACCGDGACVGARGEHCGTCPADCACPEGVPCDARAGVCRCEDRCEGDDLLACVEGPAPVRVRCEHGCNPRRAECHPLCDPRGGARCLDGQMLDCAEDGDRWLPDPGCPDGCADGECLPPIICEAGARRCVDGHLYTCSDDGREDARERCERGCIDDDRPRCRPICEVGATRCADEGRVQRCQADESGWGPVEVCPDICVLAEGRCGVSGVCRPGDFRCGPQGREVCGDQGAAFALSANRDHHCGRFCASQIGECAGDAQGFAGEEDGLLWVFGPAGWGGVTSIDAPGRRAACALMGYGRDDAPVEVAPGAHVGEPIRYAVACGDEMIGLRRCDIVEVEAVDGVDVQCPPLEGSPFTCRGDGFLRSHSLYRMADEVLRPVICRPGCSGRFCQAFGADCTEPDDRCDMRPGERLPVRFLSDDRPGRFEIAVDEATTVRLVGYHDRVDPEPRCVGQTTVRLTEGGQPFTVVGPAPCGRFEAELALPAGEYAAVVTTTAGRQHTLMIELSVVW